MTFNSLQFFICYLAYLTSINMSQAHPMRGTNVRDATSSDKLSFVVSLGRINKSGEHFCTGTLISRRSVLTSEHCIVGEDITNVQIIIGSVDLRLGQKYRVAKWKTYGQWYYNETNIQETVDDIALIWLKIRVKDPKVIPATLMFTRDHLMHRARLRLAGWGLVENDEPTSILKFGNVRVIPLDKCVEIAKNITQDNYKIPPNYFCSSAKPWLLTNCGDSGGPALNKKNKVVGITRGVCPKEIHDSYEREFKNLHLMNLHLNLFNYKNFIATAFIS